VARAPARARGRLVVADSKVVFQRNRAGEQRLEATALAFLAALDPLGRWPASGAALLASAPRELRPDAGVLARHPWYARLPDRLPLVVPPDVLARASARLVETLDRAATPLLDAGLRAVPAGELNASYDRTASKALTLWHKVAEVLEYLWERYAERGLHVVVDRQGARKRYAPLLQSLFPRASLVIEQETDTRCAYLLGARARTMRVEFTVRADERWFPVALGSCLAKYARELCMGAFNGYFTTLQPDLRPTAGYVTDARRWMDEARPALRRADLAPRVLVRER
jgi:hypothetical protein